MFRKILVIILIVSVTPALVGTLLTYSGSLIVLDSAIGDYLEQRVRLLSRKIDETLRATKISIQNLSQDPALSLLLEQAESLDAENILEDPGLRAELGKIAQHHNLSEYSLVLVTSDGTPIISTNPEKPFSFGQFSWWKFAAQLNHSEIFIAEEQGAINDKPLLILTMPAIGAETSSRADVMIACVVKLDSLLEKASFIISEERWSPGVFSSRGNLILNPDMNTEILPVLQTRDIILKSQISAWFPTQEIKNAKHIVAFSTVNFLRSLQRENKSNCEWFTYIVFDASDVAVFINLLIWRMSLLGLILVVVLIALGLYLSGRIVKPIKQLHQGMREISAGNLKTNVEIHTGDELEDLARGFNDMTRKLRETYIALENKVNELDEKARHISLIHEITQAINSDLDLDRIFAILAEELKKIVDYEYAGIALLGEDRKEIQSFQIFSGAPDSSPDYAPLPLLGITLPKILAHPKSVIKTDLAIDCETKEEKELLEQGILSYIVIPLQSNVGVTGMLTLGSQTTNQYSEKELDLLKHVADALSVAVEHSRLYARIKRLAEELEERIQERTLELEEANRKIILTEKFAATGKMAAGVAHEINNPLGIIKNYLKLFKDQWTNHSARLETLGLSLKPLEIVNDELDRIARIVRNLLDIFRPTEGKRTETDVNKEIIRLIELMKKNLEKRGIQTILDLEESLPMPRLSPDLLRQVLLNIIGNAEEAIHEKGEIHIQTRFLGAGTTGKKYIEIIIKDTGCGIPLENMGKIFDPFFSTKREGESTGLGLSVTYSILKTLGGDINIASDPGYGTRVRILLPYLS